MTDFNTSSLMTLDEAIKHAEERASLSCDECARQYREYLKPLETPNGNLFGIDLNKVPESCRGCPQHPSNGGSGICFCTLGQPIIT